MRDKIASMMMLVGLIALAACSPLSWAQEEPVVQFKVAMQVNADQEFHVSLGVRNAGGRTFQGDNSFNAKMDVRRMPSGDLRASAHVVPMPALEPGETAWPMDWRGRLEAGTYELTWGAEGYGQTVETFTIVEEDGRLYYQGEPLAPPEAESTPKEERDALVAKALLDLAERLDVDRDEITVATVEPFEFRDASLGVPEPGKSYAQMIIPGYIIRLRVEDELYAYHAAGERVVLVPRDSEGGEDAATDAAPGMLRRVTVPEIGLTLGVPADWQRLQPAFAWTPERGSELTVGVNGVPLDPPMEPEAVLLPHHAQILDSEAIDLGWARGRRFTLEVYASAAEGGETKAPVTSVEIHVLLTVDREEERLALDFYASAPCSEGLREVELTLQEMIDSAVLANVAESASPMMDEALTADWQVFEDEGYGFSLRFPQDWAYKEVATEGPGMPEDWPLERSVAFFPRAWAERFEQSGPPDPEAPPAVPAPGLEVYMGSEQAFRRAVIEPTASDVLEVNGTEVIREVDAVNQTCQLIRYVFQHPDREDVRIVLTDALTGFEERLEGNRDVAEILSTIVATFEFQD